MAAESVGQIGLDLVVNQGQFNKQMRGIQGIAKKAGAALAAAFTVKKLVDFSTQCIELGSDLQEVQNVVDVTFPRMSKQVDAFAKNAITSFGLSETMAKRFTGTFGAMAKSFGFSEKAAYDMSTTLTGLAGDVASFYNISQDEAYTKLKSVFTGETESLKDLGVVMTQSALDAYAMANGFGKTTRAMSEMEKVALRYQFVQDQLSASSGDFVRTSDSWANQVRILKLQFDSLKATIGQGLINVLTPVIKVINSIIGRLMSLANAFKAFTEMLMGKKGGGTSAAVSGMDKIAASADGAGAAMGGAARAAQKAAKKIATATTGIDELNILNPESGGGSGDSGGGGYEVDDFDMGQIETEPEEMSKPFEAFFERLKELRDLFLDGFKAGLGDVTLGPLLEAIEGIKQSLKEIFTDPGVIEAFNNWLDTMAYSLGQVAGAMTSVGITIATNLLGGLNLYLAGNKDRIKQWIISMFDITGEIASITGNFAQAFANIFSAFGKENGQRVTAALIGIFTNAFMGVTETCGKLARDILDVITRPFIENQDGFKAALDGCLGVVAVSLEAIKGIVDDTMTKIGGVYDTHVKPMFDAFANGLSSIAGVILQVYQSHIQPVLDELAAQLGPFVAQHVQPVIDSAIELIGKIANAIRLLWTNTLQPFIEWFISTIVPAIVPVIQAVIEVFASVGAVVMDAVTTIVTILGGLIDFLVGVFTGEWGLAWEGIKEIFSACWEWIKMLLSGVLDFILSSVNLAWKTIQSITTIIWEQIKASLSAVWNYLLSLVSAVFNAIASAILTAWNYIKSFIILVWEGIKEALFAVWNLIKTAAEATFMEAVGAIANAWNDLKEKTNEIWNSIWNAILTVLGGLIDFLVGVFTGEWGLAWEGIKEIFFGIWELIKSIVSGAVQFISSTIQLAWTAISSTTNVIWNVIKALLTTVWNYLSSLALRIFTAVKDTVTTIWNNLKTVTSEVWNGIQTALSTIWTTVWTTAESTFNGIRTAIENVWSALKERTGEIWNGIWDTIRGAINNIISGVENMVNRVVEGVNTMINGLNGVISSIPGLSGVSIPNMSSVSLPRLAQGGYVRANTPQLAMIGDNRHQGEVVAPEDKLQAMVDRAVAMTSGNDSSMSDRYLELMVELLQKIIDLIEAMDLTVTIDIRDIKKKLADLDKRSGYTLRTT